MVVVGIDPGTATTGYGLVREVPDGVKLVAYGVITTSPNEPMEQRLLVIYQELCQIISLYQPVNSAVEKLFFQRNVRSAMAVGQARGVVLLALAAAQIPVCEYTPLEVKHAIAGYGGAEKNQVQKMVKALLNMEDIPRPDDAADALAVAICHLHSRRMINLIK